MALSSDEIGYIRSKSGDTDNSASPAPNTSPPIVSDTMINYYFDNRTTASTTNGKLDQTIVQVLQDMKAKLAPKVQRTNSEGESKSAQQYFDHVCSLLDYWENKTGLVGATDGITISNIGLGINQPESD